MRRADRIATGPGGEQIDLGALSRLLVMHERCNAYCRPDEGLHTATMWLSKLTGDVRDSDLTATFDRQLADYQCLYVGHERSYEAPPPPKGATGRAYVVDGETDEVKGQSPRFDYRSIDDIGMVAGTPVAYTVRFYYPLQLQPLRDAMARKKNAGAGEDGDGN